MSQELILEQVKESCNFCTEPFIVHSVDKQVQGLDETMKNTEIVTPREEVDLTDRSVVLIDAAECDQTDSEHLVLPADVEVSEFWKQIGLASPRTTENRIIVEIEVFGHLVEALVDSGAIISMVHQSWVDDKDIPIASSSVPTISGFGVTNNIPIVGSITVPLKIHSFKIVPTTLHVISSSYPLAVPIILGYDFLTGNSLGVFLGSRML